MVSAVGADPDSLNSKIDIVRRLLLASRPYHERVHHDLACDSSSTKAAAFITYSKTEGLSWRDKLRQWTRWISPIGKEGTAQPVKEEGDKKPLSSASTTAQIQQALESPTSTSDTLQYSDEDKTWESRYFTKTSALMGAVLHSSLESEPASPGDKLLRKTNFINAFSTTVPNLSRVLSKALAMNEGKTLEYLVLKFQPDPFTTPTNSLETSQQQSLPGSAAALTTFPPIELRFSVDPKSRETKLTSVLAMIHEKQTDVMLPEKTVDIRFQQRTTCRLRRHLHRRTEDFFENSLLILKGGSKLEIPPRIVVPIARRLCKGDGFDISGQNTDSAGKNRVREDDVTDVPYLFTGLELRSTLVFKLNGWRLFYTSISAGRAGGRRSELKIRPIWNGRPAGEEEFVRAAYQLADDLSGVVRAGRDLPRVAFGKAVVSEGKGGLVRMIVTKESKSREKGTYGFFARSVQGFGNQEQSISWRDAQEETEREP